MLSIKARATRRNDARAAERITSGGTARRHCLSTSVSVDLMILRRTCSGPSLSSARSNRCRRRRRWRLFQHPIFAGHLLPMLAAAPVEPAFCFPTAHRHAGRSIVFTQKHERPRATDYENQWIKADKWSLASRYFGGTFFVPRRISAVDFLAALLSLLTGVFRQPGSRNQVVRKDRQGCRKAGALRVVGGGDHFQRVRASATVTGGSSLPDQRLMEKLELAGIAILLTSWRASAASTLVILVRVVARLEGQGSRPIV